MVKEDQKKGSCCVSASGVTSCCRVEALISVDERVREFLGPIISNLGGIGK